MKILIVEDEKVSQKKMQVIMQKFGECDVVADAIDAIKFFEKAWARRAPYDLITLDITLNETSGIDVLIEIRKIEKSMSIPDAKQAKVIMVTSHKDRDNITSCLTAGCDSYIVKPFMKETISKCMRRVLLKYIDKVFPDD